MVGPAGVAPARLSAPAPKTGVAAISPEARSLYFVGHVSSAGFAVFAALMIVTASAIAASSPLDRDAKKVRSIVFVRSSSLSAGFAGSLTRVAITFTASCKAETTVGESFSES